MTDDVVTVSYREMAEAATSQAAYRKLEKPTLRPEADVRRVAWWRVRGLQRTAHAPILLTILGTDALAVYATQVVPDDDRPFWFALVPLISLGVLAFVLTGVRRARHLARVARQEPGRTMRYLLLHSYVSGAPWLVFFPLTGGDEAEPIGTLPLKYGPTRDLYRDLPAPVGEATLCGDATYRSVTVPWIDGQVVWPSAGYGEICLDSDHDMRFLSELIRPE
ncbi:hypothetical protein ACFYT7_15125 [Streptomyces sp. NPDC004041]|uniref:hypothetical protein n=1 Tax=Streptomyces sp. NPDC004041 TaxID=3364688 RepID=UPI0036BD4AE5